MNDSAIDTTDDTTFHAGEIVMQQRAGVREHMADIGDRVIRDHMPEQHRELFRKLPTLVVGSVDAQRRPWASILVGKPGFVHDLDAYRLRVDAQPFEGDRLAEHLALGSSLGLLGLEPQTRRRNRMNGRVTSLDESGFVVMVDQSFGNCPQYIQARTPTWVGDDTVSTAQRVVEGGADLSDELVAFVRRADTLFIASAAPAGSGRSAGVDVSHRGGRPGFVRVDESADGNAPGSVLTMPDFRGNFFFNTLGNVVANPQVGLLFIDYERGDLLQLGGRAVVIEGGLEVQQVKGAQRLLRMVVDRSVLLRGALPLRWSAAQPAAQLAATGVWPQVAAAVG